MPVQLVSIGLAIAVLVLGQRDLPQVAHLAETWRVAAFGDYVGVPPNRSTLDVIYLHPQSRSWKITGDRKVVCFVSEMDASTTGSLEGAKR